jgi:hypothetical protein
MDHGTGQSQRNAKEQRAAVTESMAGVEERVQETVDGRKATVHCAMEGFKQLQETVDGAKGAVDALLESVKGTVNKMVEHVQPAAFAGIVLTWVMRCSRSSSPVSLRCTVYPMHPRMASQEYNFAGVLDLNVVATLAARLTTSGGSSRGS